MGETVEMKPCFGDIVENGWASEDNPTRVGFFVREGSRPRGSLNAGRYWEITDGNGKFWQVAPSGDHKLTITPVAARSPASPPPTVDAEEVARIICGFGPPKHTDGHVAWDRWKRALANARSILALLPARSEALSSPGACREKVEALLVEHVRKINRVVAAGMHEGDAIREAAGAILSALSSPGGQGNTEAQGCGTDGAVSCRGCQPESPASAAEAVSPVCRVCGKPDDVGCYWPDRPELTICVTCCETAEHADGETGHVWEYERAEQDRVCQH